ncbi:MAG: dihydropteroate synthase [Candidatus Cryptobacteroides sp.]
MNRNRKIDIMGIVNLTDDSYFAGSRCLCGNDFDKMVENALERTGKLVSEGATMIDIGACSTRPGSLPVGEEEEWRRIGPVLGQVVRAFPDIPVSIDTWWASVIEKAFDVVAGVVGEDKAREILVANDISAGEDDPEMLPVVGRLGIGYIAMHKRGNSLTMQSLCDYDDVTRTVSDYFEAFSQKAEKYGLRYWVLDPGYGFAKDIDQNYQLLAELDKITSRFAPKGIRTLVGVSRKSMIYRLFGMTPEESLAQTQVLHLKALQNGADILRVHDAAEASRTLALYRRLG